MLTSWVLWLYAGFFSLGSLAGEVDNPQRVYPIVALTLVPAVAMLCIAPIAVAFSVDGNRSHYEAGHFDTVATDLVGDWLGVSFVVAACVSQVGLFNGDMVVAERSLASFFDPQLAALGRGHTWAITRYLLVENGTGIAPVYIILNATVAAALTWLPYKELVKFQMMQYGLCSLLFLFAFGWYKWQMPHLPRPFAIPGGLSGAIALGVPVAAVTLANMWLCAADPQPVLGVRYAKLAAFAVLTGFGFFVHAALSSRRLVQGSYRRAQCAVHPGVNAGDLSGQ